MVALGLTFPPSTAHFVSRFSSPFQATPRPTESEWEPFGRAVPWSYILSPCVSPSNVAICVFRVAIPHSLQKRSLCRHARGSKGRGTTRNQILKQCGSPPLYDGTINASTLPQSARFLNPHVCPVTPCEGGGSN